ncbi:MAG: 16S rRNA processing protein RimM [Acidobacteria bacterium]|nr:16S rRNA processing protein RimM [Acidobacteriota bacterium]
MAGPTSDSSFLTVARLLRTRGNRGELVAELESDDPGIFALFPEVYLWDGAGCRKAARVHRTWLHKNRLILQFDGIDSISEAERLAGWEVQIPAARRPAPPAGRYYAADLVGCRVLEARSGRLLGEVRGLLETGGASLLQVETGGGEVLVPFASSICTEIDPAQRVIRVDLPEGLEELNGR